MAGKRYYGTDVPRSTGPHPDPLSAIEPKWVTFECPECGDVEEIDVAEMRPGVTVYPCKICGEPLEPQE